MSQGFRIQKAIAGEHKKVQDIVKKEDASGIISDNRFGVCSKEVPSVYLTHQLQIKAGFLSAPAAYWHQRVISRFDRCWVCDHSGEDSLAGDLSSNGRKLKYVNWIGPLSRFSTADEPVEEKEFDICAVLSGPEPSRTRFEERLLKEFEGRDKRIALVQGVLEDSQVCKTMGNLTIFNYLLSEELERLMRRSEFMVMRSGYSSIMDLQALRARALLVPTPGQDEQEYLARHLKEKGLYPSVEQSEFSWSSIEQAQNFEWPEMKKTSKSVDFSTLFDVFLG